MRLPLGLLALSLAALCGTTTPALAAGNVTTATDDLIEMARWGQLNTAPDTTVHYRPDESIIIDEDTELAGTWIVDSFQLAENATIVATSDLTIIARQLVNVEGQILGAHGFDAGTTIILRSFGWTRIVGRLEGGDGLCPTAGQGDLAAPGGDVWIGGVHMEFGGTAIGGQGASGLDGHDGADGGHAFALSLHGITFPSSATGLGTAGGPAGHGGNAAGESLDGNDGGDGGSAGFFQGILDLTWAGHTAPDAMLSHSFSAASLRVARTQGDSVAGPGPFPGSAPMALMIQSPAPTCSSGTGTTGTNNTTTGSDNDGSNMATMTPSTAAAGEDGTDGSSPSSSASSTGGNGGNGGTGGAGKAPKGNGGAGGLAGDGGDSRGGNGQTGQHGGSGCGLPSGLGGSGGAGGDGGTGTGGEGGSGGAGGPATSDCSRGTDQDGGTGGTGQGGNAGNGGARGRCLTAALDTCTDDCPYAGGPGSGGASVGGPGGLDGGNIDNEGSGAGKPYDNLPDPPERGETGNTNPPVSGSYGPGSEPC